MGKAGSQPAIEEPSIAADLSAGMLGLVWRAVRLPIYGTLILMEPLVGFILMGIGLLSVLAAFLFEFAIDAPNFPSWLMLGFGLVCGVVLACYESLIRAFAD